MWRETRIRGTWSLASGSSLSRGTGSPAGGLIGSQGDLPRWPLARGTQNAAAAPKAGCRHFGGKNRSRKQRPMVRGGEQMGGGWGSAEGGRGEVGGAQPANRVGGRTACTSETAQGGWGCESLLLPEAWRGSVGREAAPPRHPTAGGVPPSLQKVGATQRMKETNLLGQQQKLGQEQGSGPRLLSPGLAGSLSGPDAVGPASSPETQCWHWDRPSSEGCLQWRRQRGSAASCGRGLPTLQPGGTGPTPGGSGSL